MMSASIITFSLQLQEGLSISLIINSAARCPISNCRGSTVVSCGLTMVQRLVPEKPATATSRGTFLPIDFKRFMAHGKKTAGVFADYGFYLACGMSRYLQLKMPRQQTKITVDVNAPEAEIIRQLNDFMPSMLSGYPSNLSLLADYAELKIRPDVIITDPPRRTKGRILSAKTPSRHPK